MRTKQKNFLFALLLSCLASPAAADLKTFGFTGDAQSPRVGCASVDSCPDFIKQPAFVTGWFTFDTNAPDLDPSPDAGRYVFNSGDGTGFTLMLLGRTVTAESFEIQIVNDEFGGWCDDRTRRDHILVHAESPSIFFDATAAFDSCEPNALTSDSLKQTINLSTFGNILSFPEGLVVHYEDPTHQWSVELEGSTHRIYATSSSGTLPPATRLPEPGMLTLLGFGAIAFAFARLKCI